MPKRTVFFVSDGTGITAETFGNAILAQFDMKSRHVRLPFTDTIDKAHQAVQKIKDIAQVSVERPMVFTTLVNPEVHEVVHACEQAYFVDLFNIFVAPLELGFKLWHQGDIDWLNVKAMSSDDLNNTFGSTYTSAKSNTKSWNGMSSCIFHILGGPSWVEETEQVGIFRPKTLAYNGVQSTPMKSE